MALPDVKLSRPNFVKDLKKQVSAEVYKNALTRWDSHTEAILLQSMPNVALGSLDNVNEAAHSISQAVEEIEHLSFFSTKVTDRSLDAFKNVAIKVMIKGHTTPS